MRMEERAHEISVDLPELMARVENDLDLLREVLEIFTTEFPMLHLQLRDAMERGDLEEVRVNAHTLKGMLSSLSFAAASSCAMRIERMAAQCSMDGMQGELARMEDEAARGQDRLTLACGGVLQ